MRILMMGLSLVGCLLGLSAPLFQRGFVTGLSNSQDSVALQEIFFNLQSNNHISILWLLFFSILCVFFSLIMNQTVMYLGARESFIMQRNLGQKLYNTILFLRNDHIKGRSIGEFVSVYTTDIPGATILIEQSLPQGMGILFPLLLTPMLLIYEFKIPLVPVLIVIFGLLSLNLWLALRQSRYFYLFKILAAQRIGIVNEWIQNIRYLRVLSWIRFFENRIIDVRRLETENRVKMLNNGQSMNAIASSVTFILNVLIIWYFSLYNRDLLKPTSLITLLWVVAVFLTKPFRQLPWFFTFLFDAWTSIRRICAIYNLGENKWTQRELANFKSHGDQKSDLGKMDDSLKKGVSLEVKGLNLSLNNKKILEAVSFEIAAGEFVAIVGEVASGKTSLLLSLIGETPCTFEKMSINGSDVDELSNSAIKSLASYVSQDSFILSAHLLENIIFSYDSSEKEISNHQEFTKVLNQAQFDIKSEGLTGGLRTEIGERGVNLSGGQKQRIGLARAFFRDRPLILMDDCLSALDIETEHKITEELTTAEFSKKTRILVTHRLSVLKHVDKILFLMNGKIQAIGSFQFLLLSSPEFCDFVKSINQKVPQPKVSEIPFPPAPHFEIESDPDATEDINFRKETDNVDI